MPELFHYCNVKKLDPKDRYFMPNGIEICKECTARLDVQRAKRKHS
jgi:hypothetical protein